MTTHGDAIYQHGGMPVGDIVQGNTLFVDNRKSAANDNNTGRKWIKPKKTIQSAIDDAIPGSRIHVMGSGRKMEYSNTGFHALTGADLYGVYREQIELPYDLSGLQLIGHGRPLITGQDGTEENLTGHTPTVQIGSFGVESKGPLYCRIAGFHIGGFGDDGDDADDAHRYGVGIAIGDYWDTTYNDDCYSHIIEDCTFRQTNAVAAAQTNDEDVHTWLKGWGNEKILVRRCVFFKGQYAMGFMGSQNNQPMMWKVEDCNFHYQITACLMSSGTPMWMDVNRCLFNPASSGLELALGAGAVGNIIRNSDFPLCAESVETTRDTIAAESIGTHTGWNVMGCRGKLGHIYAEG